MITKNKLNSFLYSWHGSFRPGFISGVETWAAYHKRVARPMFEQYASFLKADKKEIEDFASEMGTKIGFSWRSKLDASNPKEQQEALEKFTALWLKAIENTNSQLFG